MNTIYLDLDGVINALSRKPPRQNTQWLGEWKQETIEGYPILWSVELVENLNTLAEREDVQFVFLTTWRELASTSFGPQVGLKCGDWEFIDESDDKLMDTQRWWKLDRIAEHIEKTKPEKVVWIDDDLAWDAKAHLWLSKQSNVIGISPMRVHGLAKKHLWMITNFLDGDDNDGV